MKNKEKYSDYFLDVVIDKFKEQQHHSFKTLEDFSKWLNEEYKEPKILDDAERRYLRNIVLPFYNRVTNVSKLSNGNREFIRIGLATESIMLPYFVAGTMYKNMKLQKEYTLKELNIWK